MDEYFIDTHKLMYHPRMIGNWLKGEETYPIYVEIAPSGGCNHRCIFCALDYLKYKPANLDTKILKKFLKDISFRGTKSIMFAGEGEPLLHKDIAELVTYAKKCDLDIAITTNGVLLLRPVLEKILPELSWLRISLNAGTAKTYAVVHRTDKKDFDKVIQNIREAITLKKKNNYDCTIGAQLLLLNENYKEIPVLAKILSDMGADYLIIKPYSQHPSSINRLKPDLHYEKLLFLEEGLRDFTKDGFKVIFRRNTMLKIREKRTYGKCFGLTFWAYLASDGELYACSAFLGEKLFRYGNIYQEPFEKIWKGKKRRQIMKIMENEWNINDCREVCRLDEINRYLWELKYPPEHVNFI